MKLIRTALLFGTGYFLGTRAGRERYEQLKNLGSKIWESSPMEKGREKAKDAAFASFQQMKDTAVDTAKSAAEAVKNKAARAEENLDDSVIIVEPVER